MPSLHKVPRRGGTLWLLAFIALAITGMEAFAAMRIPDLTSDRAFLYGDWQPNRANVVVFIDPLCPYCKKAIPKLDQVTDYNLFVYWAPIFGQRSEDAIRPFFRCGQPTGRAVLQNMINTPAAGLAQLNPNCEGELDTANRAINDAMVSSYPINGVPAFFLQGVPVTLSQIETVITEPAGYVNGVAIDWRRYKESRIGQKLPSISLAIIFPVQRDSSLDMQLLSQYRPEYLFSLNDWEALCEALSATACANGKDAQRIQAHQFREITALLGIDDEPGEVYLISQDGKLSSVQTNAGPDLE